MIRQIALYTWLALIAIAIIITQLHGSINDIPLPPQLPFGIIIAFWCVVGLLTAVNFYFLFHRTAEKNSERKGKREKRWS